MTSSFDEEVEMLRIKFGGNLRLKSEENGGTIISLEYYPNPSEPSNSLNYEITVSKDYLNNKPRPDYVAKLKISNSNFTSTQLERLAKNFYIRSSTSMSKNPICDSLDHINEVIASFKSTQNSESKTDWTLQEQQLLESALKSIDPKKPIDWDFISEKVGSKSPTECLERFKYCVNRAKTALAPTSNSTSSAPAEPEKPQPILSGVKTDINLIAVKLHGIQSYILTLIKLEFLCKRCSSSFVLSLKLPEILKDKSSTAPQTSNTRICTKCKHENLTTFTAEICHSNTSKLGTVESKNCIVKDVLESDYWITCEKCVEKYIIREVGQGSIKKVVCKNCFQSMEFGFRQIDFTGKEKMINHIRHPVAEAKKILKKLPQLTLKVGTPLAQNGACKHYKKSFRWLRFPCCGMAFPCDVCHDTETGHRCEMAKLMICGFCSTQQNFTNGPCKFCKNAPTGGTSSHWEGGKGCRDPVKLSRHDSKNVSIEYKSESTQLKSLEKLKTDRERIDQIFCSTP